MIFILNHQTRHMLKNVTPRLYQETILSTCTKDNTLVVLPTGMGKTLIAVMLTVHRLTKEGGKVVFLSPTKPLVEQHHATFCEFLDVPKEEMIVYTGEVSPAKREEMWGNAKIIFSTPQGMENDIINKRIKLNEVSLIIFDEAHHAVGDYSYVFIAQQYFLANEKAHVLALTASPGDDLEKIIEICTALRITGVEIRTLEDPDVAPYVQETNVKWEHVELPGEFIEIKKILDECFEQRIKSLKTIGLFTKQNPTKKDLITAQSQLFSMMSKGEKDFDQMRSISILAEAVKIQHALELLQTQGLAPLQNYFGRLEDEARTGKVKAVKNLMGDVGFRTAIVKTRALSEKGINHPKIPRLVEIIEKIVGKDIGSKVIVFTQFRDSGGVIVNELNKLKNVHAELFVGQAKKRETGLSQKKQAEMLEQFKNNIFNVLVATSVAEEGLDIPRVDVVVFYEPIPSAIRSIQRRGRTGRSEKGEIIVLIAKGTIDEAYRWSAHYKEKRMHKILKDIGKKLKERLDEKSKTPKDKQSTLTQQFTPVDVQIYADYREKASPVVKRLIERGANIKLEQIPLGDYVLSERVVVEYKTTEDFVNSILDGRMIEQVKRLREGYRKPAIIIEGENIFEVRKVNPAAIRGMIATITIGFGIPIIQTKDGNESAEMIISIARREQEKRGKDFSIHGDRKQQGISEAQEYMVSAIPGIGGTLAKPLLGTFKTIKNIANASEEELKKIELIGETKAKTIKRVFEEEWEGRK